jgi:hypothetical protein
VTGGMMVSAFSLIVCGVWECNATHNEMSNQEAAFSAVVPFGCFWWRHQFSKDHGPDLQQLSQAVKLGQPCSSADCAHIRRSCAPRATS